MAVALEKWNPSRPIAAALFSCYLLVNTSYVWFYKHDQFLERAEVTERLVRDANLLTQIEGMHPLEVSCFPLAPELATIALQERLNIPESQVVVHGTTRTDCGPITVKVVLD